MKNSEYIEKNNLQKEFENYINTKIELVEEDLKKIPKYGMRLTKDEKMLFIDKENYPFIVDVIKEGRDLIEKYKDDAIAEQQKKLKKIENKLDKEELEHRKVLGEYNYIKNLRETIANKKVGFFDRFKKNTGELTMDDVIAMEENFIKEHPGKDLDDALNTYLYGSDYKSKQRNVDNEVYSISSEEKNKEYAILFYINGESLDYAKKLLENNFVKMHKIYNDID